MGKHCIVNWCPDQNMPETQDLVHVFTTCIEHIMGSFSDQIDKCINYSWPKNCPKKASNTTTCKYNPKPYQQAS